MQTIVVGYDEGEPAKRALERARQLAKAFGGKVLVTSVARALVPAAHGLGRSTRSTRSRITTSSYATPPLSSPSRACRASSRPVWAIRAHEILRIAEERDADLIVVGTREPDVSPACSA